MKPGEETSVEEWQDRFKKDAQGRPGWRVLPVEYLFSPAFLSLSPSAKLALLFALTQISWEKTKRPGKRSNLKNDTVYLPTNALKALGITSSSTRTAARKELVEKGFLDVKKTGSYLNCGVFRLSGRWRYYPNGDYQPQDQPLPGICMGHRFKGKVEDENVSEDSFLRLKNERKALRLISERTVQCTMAEQSDDDKGVQVQEEYRGEEEAKVPFKEIFSSTSTLDAPDINQELPNEPIQVSLEHEWFLGAFREACTKKGIDPDLTLPSSLASSLDDWITKRLSKGNYLGNKFCHDENISNINEKLGQIISQWEFIRIPTAFGQLIEVPPLPDLSFLITNIELIFRWISEQRQCGLEGILEQFGIMEQTAPGEYTH